MIKLSSFGWLLIPAIVLTACSGGAGGQRASSQGPLRIVAGEPELLDPAIATTAHSQNFMELIYEPLVDYDAKENIIPGVAKSWDVSSDQKSYTFHLQPNAKFSDGSDITAQDVVFSLTRDLKSAVMGADLKVVDNMQATDSRTVRITLKNASRAFLPTLAKSGNAGILSQKAVQAAPNYFTKPVATSGPWMIQDYVSQDHSTLVANPNYWDTGFPKIKTIRYGFSGDTPSSVQGLLSGSVDMYFPFPATSLEQAKTVKSVVIGQAPKQSILYWGFNKTKPPFNDVRVRQAIAWSAPRDERKQLCWGNTGTVSYGQVLQSWSWAYTPDNAYKTTGQDGMAKAAKLLDEAGWQMGPNGVRVSHGVAGLTDGTPFNVTVPYESDWQQSQCSTELLQQRLKPLGVNITPFKHDEPTYWTDVAAGKDMMFHGGHSADNADSLYQSFFTTGSGQNALVAQWSNPDVDRLVAQAAITTDTAKAKDLYFQAQQIIDQQVPIVVTGSQAALVGYASKVHGFYTRPDASNRALIHATLG